MQLQRIPMRIHPKHNLREALHHKKRSHIPQLKRRPPPPCHNYRGVCTSQQYMSRKKKKKSVDSTATRVEPHAIKIQ